MRPVVRRRSADQLKAIGTIECPNHEQMRKPLNICQALFKFGQNLKRTFCFMLRAQSFGDLRLLFVRAPHKANRLQRKQIHHRLHRQYYDVGQTPRWSAALVIIP